MTHPRPSSAVLARIDPMRCTGCGRCIGACAPRVIEFQTIAWRKRAMVVRPTDCTGCALCVRPCPTQAIGMTRQGTASATGQAHQRPSNAPAGRGWAEGPV